MQVFSCELTKVVAANVAESRHRRFSATQSRIHSALVGASPRSDTATPNYNTMSVAFGQSAEEKKLMQNDPALRKG